VTDAAGTPVQGLQATSIDGHTGEPFTEEQRFTLIPGTYVVISDGHMDLVGDSDVITFTAEGPDGSATGQWNIAADDCHITNLGGPATLVLQ